MYNQANLNVASPEEIAELEEELKQTKELLADKNRELKAVLTGGRSQFSQVSADRSQWL